MKILEVIFCLFCIFGLYKAQKVCSSFEQNVDYKGNDLTFTYDAKSAQACADICSLVAQCNGFTFWIKTNACFLKNFTQTPSRTSSADRISCIMVKSPASQSGCDQPTVSSTTPVNIPTISSTTAIYTGPSTAPPKCLSEQGAFYGDAPYSLDFRNSNSFDECCNLCASYGSNCAAFSFLTDNLICYVYSNPLPAKLNLPNAIGGILNPNSAYFLKKFFKFIN